MASGFHSTPKKSMTHDSHGPSSSKSPRLDDLTTQNAKNGQFESKFNISHSSEDSLDYSPRLTMSPERLGIRLVRLIIDFLVTHVLTFTIPANVLELQQYLSIKHESHNDFKDRWERNCPNCAVNSHFHSTDELTPNVQYGSPIKEPQIHFQPPTPPAWSTRPKNQPNRGKFNMYRRNPNQNQRGPHPWRQYPNTPRFNNYVRPFQPRVNFNPHVRPPPHVNIDISTNNGQNNGLFHSRY